MKDKTPTPDESLEIIHRMIEGSKARLQENGSIYLFWGWMILVCALAQFVLLQMELYRYNYYPYFLLFFAGIYTGIVESRKHRNSNGSYLHSVMSLLWLPIAVNLVVIGFLTWPQYEISPTPFILIFLAIGAIVSGAVIRFRPLIWGGILCNLVAFAALFTPPLFQPLLLAGGIVIAELIPGYLLRKQYKASHG